MISADTFVVSLVALLIMFLGGGSAFVLMVVRKLSALEVEIKNIYKLLDRRNAATTR